jgi:hypothetical protein
MQPVGCVAAGVLAWLCAAAAARAEVPVDLELVLAVDVSGSMDQGEQALQRRGYVEALAHPDVAAAVRSGPYGRIAVAYVEWAGPNSQVLTVPWTLLEGGADAEDFAAGLAEAPPARFRGTSISGALGFAAPLFDGNGFAGLRRVIDVSGDGPNNAGAPVEPVRDAVLEAGIVINGLPLQLDAPVYLAVGGRSLADYYRDCVVGGPGAFVIPVTERDQLLESIRRKLVLEIAGLPARLVPAAETVQPAPVDCLVGERLRRNWEREP